MFSEKTSGTLPTIASNSSTEHLLKEIHNTCFTPSVYRKCLEHSTTFSKAPFIATQLNSTGHRVQLCKWGLRHTTATK